MYTLRHAVETLSPAVLVRHPEWTASLQGAHVLHVCVDSREARPGSLFVALKGEHADGHDYVPNAFEAGAIAALVDRPVSVGAGQILTASGAVSGCAQSPYIIQVPDALCALHELAKGRRASQRALRVVGVTGSVGKTTTKECIAGVLSGRYATLKSTGNRNNEIGLPLTLMALTEDHERAVLEMGMYALGEIALLCDIARPQTGVVTNVGPVHLERLGSIDRVAQAKEELVASLPEAGLAVLNGDDARVRAMGARAHCRVLTYGLGQDCDVRAEAVESQGLDGVRYAVRAPALLGEHAGMTTLSTSMLGQPAVLSSLAAVAVGLDEGLDWGEIQAGLHAVGRGLRLVLIPGILGTTILDDTYNASPASTIAALGVLGQSSGRRIAVLGDMLELGSHELEGHTEVGRSVATLADLLIAVGQRARHIAQGAIDAGMARRCVYISADAESAIPVAKQALQAGDTLLVKGSRGMAMERIVTALEAPHKDA